MVHDDGGGMVGRGAELARLVDALTRAGDGTGRTVVVGGEAGIGKTRLVSALEEQARGRGVTVLSGACLPASAGSVPYAPYVEWLRALARSVEPARLPAMLGPAREEIARLMPELPGSTPRATAVERDRAGTNRLFEAVLIVVERIASGGPVLLAIEDLQWADDDTLALTTFLSRNLRDAPVLVVVTIRSDRLEAGSTAARWLAELDLDQWVDRMELEPLDRAQVIALARRIGGGSPTGEALESIVERSGGNPFFIEQLAAAGAERDRLPRRLRDVLVARLAELPAPTRDVLRAAAAAGRRVDDSLLAAVLHMPDGAVADALRPALDSGILIELDRPDGRSSGYAFRHSLIAEVAYEGLLIGERDRLHIAFARELQHRGRIAGVEVTSAELAHHWVAARDAEHATPTLIDAGREAEGVYAFREALHHYETALDLWDALAERPIDADRVTVVQRAAECAVATGAYARAVQLGREAIAIAEIEAVASGRSDPLRLGALHDRLRWYLWEAGDRAAAEAAVDEALRLIPTTPPSPTRARALGQAAGLRLVAGDPFAATALAQEAISVAHAAAAVSEEAFALGVLGWCEAVTGDADRGLATYRAALALAESLGGVEGIALGHASLAALLDEVGRSQESLESALEGFRIAERLGVARTYGGALLASAAKAQFDLGRWDEAAASADEGLGLDPVGTAAAALHIAHGRVDANRGRFDDADRHLRTAAELRPTGYGQARLALVGAIVELAVLRGRLAVVRAAVDEAVGALAAVPDARLDPGVGWVAWYALRAEADAAVLARAAGDDEAFAPIDDRLAALSVLVDDDPAAGHALEGFTGSIVGLCQAELQRARGASNGAAWGSVADSWDELGRPAVAAYARYRATEALLGGHGDRSAARAQLRRAHATAIELGAEPLRVDIERLARQARIALDDADGDRVPKDPLGLTDREAEVIRLVAAGRSNQQIADELFITRKTASVHVSNILGKLGVSNRVEAAAVAQRLGLGSDGPGA
ncbi:MAG TPA: AAA family ATPase [Candidatus Limnocylindrales bacterium]|nr:AAA family ATPase [Candidatus Limnocylindrales bacterium]